MADGDVVLRLLIKGVEPSEIERMASLTGQQLVQEASKINARVRELQDQHNRLYIAADRKRVQEQIKAEQERGKAVQQLYAEEEKALARLNLEREKGAAHQSQSLADLAHLTEVGRAAGESILGTWERFHQFGEEIIRTTQIYGSLKGSIDEMRKATGGEVADIDLITAKNRALQKDLTLTDHQFGSVSAAAKMYADALGINTKEALDSLIDGLATGRVKMLQHAGIMVDAKKATDDYAASIGELSEHLTDEEKLHAVQAAALEKIEEKTKGATEGSHNLASALERLFAGIKNTATATLNAIGSIQVEVVKTQQDLIYELRSKGEITAEEARRRFAELDRLRKEELDKAHADYMKMAADRAMGEGLAAFGGEMGTGATDQPFGIPEGPHSFTGLGPDTKKIEELKKRAAEKQRELRKQANELFAPIEREAFQRRRGAQGNFFAGMDIGSASETLTPEGEGADAEKELRKLADAASNSTEPMEKFIDSLQKAVDAADEWKNATSGAFDQVTAAGQQMAEALGESLAAALAGDGGASFGKLTHNVLKNLAAQALGQGLMRTALGIASLADGNLVEAALNFKAAAAFAAVGVGAGLAARGVGGGEGGGGTTNQPTVRRGGDFGTSTARSSSGRGAGDLPALNISVGVFTGTEDELGRIIDKATQAWAAKTGRRLVAVA